METRMTLRIPADMLRRVREVAKRQRRSVHAQLLVLIERALGQEDEDAR